MVGGDVTKAKIKIMMPPKQLKPAAIRNGRKASKRGRTLGSNLDFLPVGWETPPLSWVSQPQARGAKVILSDHLGASSDYSFCVPTQFRLKSRFLTFLLGRLQCAKLSGTGLSDAVQTELKGYLHWLKNPQSLSSFICPWPHLREAPNLSLHWTCHRSPRAFELAARVPNEWLRGM